MLFQVLEKIFLIFPIWYDMSMGLLYMAFIILRYNTYMPYLVQDFIIRDDEFFSNNFSAYMILLYDFMLYSVHCLCILSHL